MAKKVLLISGSPKKNGNTMLILQECAKVIEAEGLKTEILSLAGRKIQGCVACYGCETARKCMMNSDVNEFIEKIKEADGLIIGSPVYFGTARGDLLNLLQRIALVDIFSGNFLKGKIGGPVTVSRTGGYKLAIQELLTFFRMCGMKVPKSAYMDNVIGRNPGEALNDKKGMKKTLEFAKNVANTVKNA